MNTIKELVEGKYIELNDNTIALAEIIYNCCRELDFTIEIYPYGDFGISIGLSNGSDVFLDIKISRECDIMIVVEKGIGMNYDVLKLIDDASWHDVWTEINKYKELNKNEQ